MDKENKLCFVQLLHPGEEPKPDNNKCISWNRGRHKRKFLKSGGTFLKDDKENAKGELMFWGEWEPESGVTKVKECTKNGPRYIHKPFYKKETIKKIHSSECASDSPTCAGVYQNTDPWVFGDRFFYSICHQHNKRGSTQLRHLEKGSLVLFGSCKNREFGLDTVFVVGDFVDVDLSNIEDFKKKTQQHKVPQEYIDVTVLPFSKFNSFKELRFYIGATQKNPYNGMFSYFPCKLFSECANGFERPKISFKGKLKELISLGLKQNFKTNKNKLNNGDVKPLWDEVKKQVLEQKCLLGIKVEMPKKE